MGAHLHLYVCGSLPDSVMCVMARHSGEGRDQYILLIGVQSDANASTATPTK